MPGHVPYYLISAMVDLIRYPLKNEAVCKTKHVDTLNGLIATGITLMLLIFSVAPANAISAELIPYNSNSDKLHFSLPDLKEKVQTLPDYKGKVVLVNFWASWCPPCIYEMPELKKLKKHFADRPFEILAINVGEKKYRVRKFAKLIKLDLPVLLDTSSTTFNDWGVKTLPTSFLIDVNSKVRYRVRGNPGWDNDQTIRLITKLTTESIKPARP